MKRFWLLPLLFILACQQQSRLLQSTVKHPAWSVNKAVYELNIRQFSQAGNLKAVQRRLPAIKELGAGIIWLMPIYPIGEKNRKGTLGSYYSVKDYRKVNPEFGTMQDLKDLAAQAHRIGLYVILDWVANHTAWDNPLTQTHPEWYTHDSLGNFVSPVKGWQDVIDLNYNNKSLWHYMIESMKFWLRTADVDGFRCDVAEMVPLPFWEQARKELEKIKPVFMLAEGESPALQRAAFDMTYSWNMYHAINQIAAGKKNALYLDTLLAAEKRTYPPNALRLRFITNHDENSWNGTVFERLDGGSKTFAVLMATIPGKPLLYSGQEAGLNKRLSFFEKDPIEWRVNNYRRFYRRLFGFYQENPALYKGSMEKIPTDNDDFVYAFARRSGSKTVVVLLNLSPRQQKATLTSSQLEGPMLDYFSGLRVNYQKKRHFVLEPWAYRVFIKGKFPTANISQ